MSKQLCKKAANNHRDTIKPDILARAVHLHQTGDLTKAELLYRQLLQLNPGHSDALHLLGVIAYQTGRNEAAVDYIARAIAINPSVSYYYNNLGSAFQGLNKIDEAVRCFKEAIRLNSNNAEAYNNLGNAFREKERDDEALENYRRAIELKSDFADAHNNLANMLKDRGEYKEAVEHYRIAVRLKPDSAEAHYNFGNALLALNDPDGAIHEYTRANELKPDIAAVYNNMGNALKKSGKPDKAVQCYLKAIELKQDFAEAYNNLGDTYRIMGRMDDAIRYCLNATRLNPGSEQAFVNLGTAFLDQGDVSGALKNYEHAITIKPDFADAHYNKGLGLLLKGDFEEGWREYEWRLMSKDTVLSTGFEDTGLPIWDGSSLDGKTILVNSEQGIGDALQFIRYLPLVKARGGRVLFECHKALIQLFAGLPGIDMLIEKPYKPNPAISPEVCIPLLSLAGIFGVAAGTACGENPYIKADDGLVGKWKARTECGGLFKVGLVWAGNPDHRNDHNRSCRLTEFGPLALVPGIALFSLQKGGPVRQLDTLPSGFEIRNIGPDLADFVDTAAVIANLDLVISVDTAVVHLAGALGKPVWTLLSFVPDWRWMLERDDSPWYPTMCLFRQPCPGDWQSVIANVAHELIKVCV